MAQNKAAKTLDYRPQQRHSLYATGAMFGLHGTFIALFVSLFPVIKETLGGDDARFSYALTAMGFGSLLATIFSTRLVQVFGSQKITLLGGLSMCALFGLLPHCSSFGPVFATFLVLGIAIGLTDVSMNVQASHIESHSRKNYMTRIHACWSIGGIVGGLLAGLIIERLAPAHFAVFSAITLAAAVTIVTRSFLQDPPVEIFAHTTLPLLPFSLLPLVAIAFLVYLAGGGVRDWSAIYLQKDLGSSLSTAVQIYAAFSAATAVGRLGGDTFRSRFGEKLLIIIGGALGGVALLAGLFSHSATLMFTAVAVFGLAHANLIPSLISFASKADPGHEARNVSGIMATGSVGYAVGPVVIGAVANGFSLIAGLGVIVAASLLVALIGLAMTKS